MPRAALEYAERPAAPSGVPPGDRPRHGEPFSAPAIVLLHGFGANAEDLYPLADTLDPKQRCRWILPNAPYAITMFGPRSRAWFPRSEAELEAAATGVYFQNLRRRDPVALRAAGDEVAGLCRSLELPADRTVLGGFSQGSMVAIEAALRDGFRPAALAVFSGALIAENRWGERMPAALAGVPVLQSHGTLDPILPFADAVALSELLQRSGALLDFHHFEGGHTIPPEIAQLLMPLAASASSS